MKTENVTEDNTKHVMGKNMSSLLTLLDFTRKLPH